ncbi:MAG: hypothetical protein H0Z28_12265 [Archaeoglobus sp.]|nr:hypothetical protein [Archaeoglobus sp.]
MVDKGWGGDKLSLAKKGLVLLLLVAVVGVVAYEIKLERGKEAEGVIPFLAPEDVMNPEIAKKYNISGYIEITSPNGTIFRGNNSTVIYYLHFVSYNPNIKETKVRIDPKGDGLSITQVYLDDKGERKEFSLNDFVKYEPQGNITIRNGETIAVKMTIRLPKLKASYIPDFPVRPVGISADVPVIIVDKRHY